MEKPSQFLEFAIKIAKEAVDVLPVVDHGLALEALPEVINRLEEKMDDAAKQLNFEEAAQLRDQIKKLRQRMIGKK